MNRRDRVFVCAVHGVVDRRDAGAYLGDDLPHCPVFGCDELLHPQPLAPGSHGDELHHRRQLAVLAAWSDEVVADRHRDAWPF